MSDITISVIQPPSTTINVGVDETTLIQAGIGLPPHSVTHISGGSDEINHNLLAGLQGGSGGQYYHLSSGQYFNLITGVDLSPYATITYVTGISGQLQAQITVLNNQTGSYVLNSQTGQFYSSSNPSGFITGVDLSFSGNYYTKTESEFRYVNVTGAETILGDKTFHDKVYINNLYVTGLETIVNTTNTNVASNYIMLNLTGGAVDGGIFFVTGSGLTGINDSGAIIGFDHSDEFKFGIGTRASDLSTLSTIASFSDVTGASGNLQTQINTLNSATGSYILDTETGQFYPNNNPSSYTATGYVTGVSGNLQTQITTLNNQTGSYYPRTNPSGFITGINNIVYTTGDQIISGAKTFTGSFNVSTNDAIIIRSTGYTHGVEIGGGYFNKIADGGFTNDFGVGGTENHFGDSATSSNSFGGSAVQNDFGAYATLNNYYGGSVIGELIFDTAPTFIDTTVRDSFINSSLGASENANPGSLVLRSSLGYSKFSEVITTNNGYSTTYSPDKITLTIAGDPPDIYTYNFPLASGTIALDSTAVMLQGNQTVNDVKNFTSIPTVNNTGVLLSGSSYITGISGGLQTQITTLNNQTGSFYPNTNPSGYISGISNLVFTTGNQTISGAKTFTNNLTVNGGDLFVDTSNNRVGIGTASPITTLDVNGSGLFRSGLNANLIISTGSPLNILGKDNAIQAFPGNFIGASINLNAGSGNFIPGSISLKGGAHPTVPGAISLNGGLGSNPNIPEGKISLNSKSIEVNKNNNYTSSTIFYKTGFPFESENINISQNSISINNNLLINGNRPTVNSTGILLSGEATTQDYVTGISGGLQTQITTLNNQTGNYYTKDESESRYVNTTGAETILGNKTFHDNVYINNLYVTGFETIVNTTNTNVASNYIMLNLTGGAVDGGIFFVTGSGLTGINDSGAIIGFDHSDEFKFGISTRASDLSTLNTIASVEQMTGISGGLQTQISTLNNQTGSYVLKIESGQFYPNSNPSGFITGVDLSSYATQNYVTGISGELQSQINSLVEDSNTIIGLSIFL